MLSQVNPIWDGAPTAFVPSSLGRGLGIQASAVPGNGSAAANTAYFLPFTSPHFGGISSITVNVASANGNIDMGVYTYDGTLIASSGAQAVSLGNETWTPTNPVPISGGVDYWIAMSTSSATATFCRFTGTALVNAQLGMVIQATAHPLPSTATFATSSAATFVPIFALTLV